MSILSSLVYPLCVGLLLLLILLHLPLTTSQIVTVSNGLIYDYKKGGADPFKYGHAPLGAKCIPQGKQPRRWSKISKIESDRPRTKAIQKLLMEICPQYKGVYCDRNTGRCDCKHPDMTVETSMFGSRGCFVLVGSPCDFKYDYSDYIHPCVRGAECDPATQKCVCVMPGYGNCTMEKNIPVEINGGDGILGGPNNYCGLNLILILLQASIGMFSRDLFIG